MEDFKTPKGKEVLKDKTKRKVKRREPRASVQVYMNVNKKKKLAEEAATYDISESALINMKLAELKELKADSEKGKAT